VPRHGFGRGEGASAREKMSTSSCWPPAHEEDEDDPHLCFLDEGVWWAGVGLRLRASVGLWCWAAPWAARPGKPFSLFLFLLYFLFCICSFKFIFEFCYFCRFLNYLNSIRI
jgi:hypothetical protein